MDGKRPLNSTNNVACEMTEPRERRHKKRSLVLVDDKENSKLGEMSHLGRRRSRSNSSNHSKKKKKKRKKAKKCEDDDDDEDACSSRRQRSKDSSEMRSCPMEQPEKHKTKENTKNTHTLMRITPNAVESLVTFAQSSGKDKPSLEQDLVVRIRLDESTISHNSNGNGNIRNYHFMAQPSHDQTLLATLDDSTHTLPVLLLNDARNEPLQAHILASATSNPGWITVVVRGLMATDGHNPKYDLDPIICLTTVELLSKVSLSVDDSSGRPLGSPYPLPTRKDASTLPQETSQGQQQRALSSNSSTARVRAGTVGTFLNEMLPFLTTDEFTRCHDTATQRLLLSEPCTALSSMNEDDNQDRDDSVLASWAALNHHAEQVQTFLTRHAAMMTLQASSQPTEHAVQNYTDALREFASSQLDRQKASLASNAGREAADRANLITLQYTEVLEQAMSKHEWTADSNKGNEIPHSVDADLLTTDRLLQWHSTLLRDLHPEAGQIRTKTVRAGHTVFCRPKEISSELEKFCLALTNLQERLHLGAAATAASAAVRGSCDTSNARLATPNSTTTTAFSSTTNAWHAVLFAAVAMYGIVDIHPFADGNGRMSRIVANWALKFFPFTINLFATPAQRAEYILALEQTRHLLSLSNQKKVHGTVTSHEVLQVTKSIGIFAPLVRLLMDRMGRAVVEFHRVWQEKSGLAAEALECKAARLARERAKEGSCIICLDENPNIATLCCGKAVHLNCIAEWLSGQNSCPCCRSELPSISGRVVRAARSAGVENSRGRRGDGDAPIPSRRRLHRQFFRNAHDILVNVLNNYEENQNSTTDTAADDGYNSSHDTTTVQVPQGEDEDVEEIFLEEDDEESSSSDEDDSSLEDSEDESYVDGSMNAGSTERSFSRRSQDNDSSLSEQGSNRDDSSSNASNSDGQDESRQPTGYRQRLDIDLVQDTTTVEDEGGAEEPLIPRAHEYCDALYCRNRPAIDCANNLCGRCCVLGGEFHCPRHNS